MSNSEIRTLAFNQGVSIALPPNSADVSNKVSLDNNSVNTIDAIGWYLNKVRCAIIDIYIYRRTDSGFSWSRATLSILGTPDGATNPDKWELSTDYKKEKNSPGVTYSLTDTDVEKSNLVISLNDMAGSGHECTMYYKLSTLLT